MRTIIPWQNRLFGNFDSMQELVGKFFTEEDGTRRFLPQTDVMETESHFEVSFDLPGISPDEVEIEVHEGQLAVSGSREVDREQENVTYHRLERQQGKFRRVFNLPADVSEESIAARYHDGVLTVSIPKVEQAVPKKINVEVTDN